MTPKELADEELLLMKDAVMKIVENREEGNVTLSNLSVQLSSVAKALRN